MSAGQYVASALLSIVVSATTVVVMHIYVTPKMPVATVEVPQVSGLMVDQARAITEPLGLLLVLDGEKIPDADKVQTGSLFEQRPLKGSRVAHGGEVHAYIAIPPQLSTVPALVGQVVAAAEQQLQVAGLRLGAVTEEVSATIPPGQVISTRPAAGEKLRKSEAVSLVVSKAQEQIEVPSVRGRTLGGARQVLEQLGLVLGDVRKGTDDNAADGAVLRQNPPAGTKVQKGQKVDLVVND
ncbi:MAG: PASTA domain-containing protein [Myxococcales bacterium]|nr:PASTA domain-containing protein [Myxococcales bacterium]